MWAGCEQGARAAALCQHKWDSCDEWAKEPPQRHAVPNFKHTGLLRTAEPQQQQKQQQQQRDRCLSGLGGQGADSSLYRAGSGSHTKLCPAAVPATIAQSTREFSAPGFWSHSSVGVRDSFEIPSASTYRNVQAILLCPLLPHSVTCFPTLSCPALRLMATKMPTAMELST